MPDAQRISLIVAVAENGVIGRAGGLPWRLSADLQRFKRLTVGHPIVMGRKTWDSLGRALPGRTSIVVTRNPEYRPAVSGVLVACGLAPALELAAAAPGGEECFVIGGAELYRAALPHAHRLHLTRVHATVDGDTHFPEIDPRAWRLAASERHEADDRNEHPCSFELYERVAP